jgi:hypothetical protein
MGFAAAIGVAGLDGVSFQSSLPGRLPAPLDWAALAAVLERDARPGDAIAVSPAWAERVRLVAPARVPVLTGRPAGGDLPGVRRVWLAAIPDAPGFGWDAERELLAMSARHDPALALGALAVSRYDVAAPLLPSAFLPDRLAQARVTLAGGACRPDGTGAFTCGGTSTARAARSVREVAGLPRPCLVLAPEPGAAAPLTVELPGVPVGRTLLAHAGLAGDPGAPAPPLRIVVTIDGEEAGGAELAGPGWQRIAIDTTRFAGPARTVALALTASAPSAPLCLDAMTLP